MLIAVDPHIAPMALDTIPANVREAGMVAESTKNAKRAIANARVVKDFTSPQLCESMEKLKWAMITERNLVTIATRLTDTYLMKITPRHMSIIGCLNHGTRTDLSVSLIL